MWIRRCAASARVVGLLVRHQRDWDLADFHLGEIEQAKALWEGALRLSREHGKRSGQRVSTVTIFDQPDRPLALETFINVAEEDQRRDVAPLIEQEELLLAFCDEDLTHQPTQRVAARAWLRRR